MAGCRRKSSISIERLRPSAEAREGRVQFGTDATIRLGQSRWRTMRRCKLQWGGWALSEGSCLQLRNDESSHLCAVDADEHKIHIVEQAKVAGLSPQRRSGCSCACGDTLRHNARPCVGRRRHRPRTSRPARQAVCCSTRSPSNSRMRSHGVLLIRSSTSEPVPPRPMIAILPRRHCRDARAGRGSVFVPERARARGRRRLLSLHRWHRR